MLKTTFIVILLALFNINMNLTNASETANENKDTLIEKTEYLVVADLVFDEIYDIDISEGEYKTSVEIMLSWEADTSKFLKKFGDEIIHGKKLDDFLDTTWHPEFFISNAENPRTTHVKTLDVLQGKFELFERFEVVVSIGAEMPTFPFGNLDLFLDIASFSGSTKKMLFQPASLEIGHHDADEHSHEVIKGPWILAEKYLERQGRSSLNHGGKEKFSYLVSHIKVKHSFITTAQKIFTPLLILIFLSLFINRYLLIFEDESGGNNGNWRVGGQITLVLALFALRFSLSGSIPTTHYLTFIDALFVTATIIIVGSLCWGIYVIYLMQNGFIEKAKSFDKSSNLILLLLTVILFGWCGSFIAY